jgi:Predicted heme/steroid binding protein
MILNQLRYKVSQLAILTDKCEQAQLVTGIPQTQLVKQALQKFTLEELATYNGKNGNPAYVAVNDIVYEVGSNAAWAAATHFGLTAGKDLTEQFNSCHAGQQILNKLRVVGKLV